MKKFWQTLVHQLQKDRQVFLALVIKHTKGSPGTTGAKMFVSQSGEIFGTIGGGVMEFELIERAKEILKHKDFLPEIQTLFHRSSGVGEKSGLICGGSQTNLYYLCHPQRDRETLEKVVSFLQKDISSCLYIEPEGISVQEQAVILTQPQINLIQASGRWLYQEQLLNRNRIAIIGGGHCALALSRVMQQLDYEVLVFDTRPLVTTLIQNTYAQFIKIVQNYQETGGLIPFPELTFVVVMTTDFLSDVRALLGVLSLPCPFIGVMGSSDKIAQICQCLHAAGVSKNLLSRLYAPVGLSIGSHTPEEIAISVAAQIIQERHNQLRSLTTPFFSTDDLSICDVPTLP
ncbi:MAG: XdhC family protein [Prochloraceae cyanobacterium]|nr:XdhC family protein [Prochloraceae cyanobacterium]